MLDRRLLPLGVEQHPTLGQRRTAEPDRRPARQVRGSLGAAVGRHQTGTRDQTLAAFRQNPHDDTAVLDRRRPHADGDVDPLARNIHPAVGRLQDDRDIRIPRHERVEHPADMHMQQRDRTGQPDRAPGRGLKAVDGLLRGVGFDQHRLAVLEIDLAHLGQAEMPGGPLDQPHAQPVLELRDPAAQPGFLHPQCPPGGEKPPCSITCTK